MARLLEHDVKRLLRARDVPVPGGAAASSPHEAAQLAEELGPEVVVKALVPANRRGAAGGIQPAATSEQTADRAAALLGSTVLGFRVEQVLVEQRVAFEQELFLSIVLGGDSGLPLVLASRDGGVDVEATLEDSERAPAVLELNPWAEPLPFRLRELWRAAGLHAAQLATIADISRRAVKMFFELDAITLELNPLVVTRDGAIAVGALLAVDDAALPRHPDLARVALAGTADRPPTALELAAAGVAASDPYRGTARFIELEGDIGLLVGGGGGSLVFFDAVRRAGGRPACYTEIGGNPSAEKVRGLTKVVLSCPGVRGLLVGHNITNNTQVDLVAEGVAAALSDLGIDTNAIPVVARELGTHDQEGRRIFERAGVEYLGEEATMEDAARRIVERVSAGAA